MHRSNLLLAALGLLATTAVAQPAQPTTDPRPLIDGLVLDVLGDGVAAAEVRAEQGGRIVGRGTSDGNGRFRLRLPVTGAELVIQATGKAAVRLPWRGAARSPVQRVVLEDGADLRGRVLDLAGAAVGGARVLATAVGFRTETTTAADGSFRLVALPLRGLNLFAVGTAGRSERRLRLTADAHADLTIAGSAGRALAMVSGLPAEQLPTASMRVFGSDVAAAIDGGRMALRADATAEFMLRNACLTSLDAPGYTTTPATNWLAPNSRLALTATPTLLPVIGGTLRALNGKPVVGLQVVLHDRSGRQLASAITGDGGSFRTTASLPLHLLEQAGPRIGLRLGEGLLIADSARQFRDGFCWVDCDPRQPMPLQVEPAATVRQRLVDEQGQALAFAEVTVVDQSDDAHHRPLLSSYTDGDGRLELDLPPFAMRMLTISPTGAVQTAAFGESSQLGAPVWKPVRCGHVEGRLLDGAGTPVPGIEILVASVDLQVGGNDAAVRQRVVVRTDRLGRFRCRGLPIGDWTLATLDVEQPANDTFVAKDGETTKVELQFAR